MLMKRDANQVILIIGDLRQFSGVIIYGDVGLLGVASTSMREMCQGRAIESGWSRILCQPWVAFMCVVNISTVISESLIIY